MRALAVLLAIALCCLYSVFAISIKYTYLFQTGLGNPQPSQLLALCELLNLIACAVASRLSFYGSIEDDPDVLSPSRDQRTGSLGMQAALNSNQHNNSKSPLKSSFNVPLATPGKNKDAQPHSSIAKWPAWAQSTLVNGVPALLYCIGGNLQFHALSLLPAYTFALLSTYTIITTALLSKWVLSTELDSKSHKSLALMFLGTCLGQWATVKAHTGASYGAVGAAGSSSQLWAGCLAMLGVALLSALVNVHLAWAVESPAMIKDSIHHHNARVSCVAMLLNLCYYLQQQGSLHHVLADIWGVHWAAAGTLAAISFINNSLTNTALFKPSHGPGSVISSPGTGTIRPHIIEIYAITLAVLPVLWANKRVLLLDRPPLLFYIGILLSIFAAVRLHYTRSSTLPRIQSRISLMLGDCGGWRPTIVRIWKAAFVAKIMLLLLLPLLAFSPGGGSSSSGSAAAGGLGGSQLHNTAANYLAAGISEASLAATTNTPVADAQLAAPVGGKSGATTAAAAAEAADQVQGLCPVMDCSTAATCTATDHTCCAYINLRMLAFLDKFLTSRGLQNDYLLVYSTLLGALRNHTLLPTASSVDIGVSAKAVADLVQKGARREAWKRGYVFFRSNGTGQWRLCAHKGHPSPHFRSQMNRQQERQSADAAQGGIELHLMWEAPHDAQHNSTAGATESSSGSNSSTAPTAANSSSQGGPTEAAAAAGTAEVSWPQHWFKHHMLGEHSRLKRGTAVVKNWRLCMSDVTLTHSPPTHTNITGLVFPTPDNAEEHLLHSFGPDWQQAGDPVAVPKLQQYGQEECDGKTQELVGSLSSQG